MGFFDKAKDLYSLQKQAKAIKKELKAIHIEAESEGVVVTVTGEQEFVSFDITDAAWQQFKDDTFGKKKLADAALKSLNKAMKKAQEIGSTKMKGIWGEMGSGPGGPPS